MATTAARRSWWSRELHTRVPIGNSTTRSSLLVSLLISVPLLGCASNVSELDVIWWQEIGHLPRPDTASMSKLCSPNARIAREAGTRNLANASARLRELVIGKIGDRQSYSPAAFLEELSSLGFECVGTSSLRCRATTYHYGYYKIAAPPKNTAASDAIDWRVTASVESGAIRRESLTVSVAEFCPSSASRNTFGSRPEK